jgi:hypothetical protein
VTTGCEGRSPASASTAGIAAICPYRIDLIIAISIAREGNAATFRRRYGIEAAGEVLLPDPGARLASTTFDEWLRQQRLSTR